MSNHMTTDYTVDQIQNANVMRDGTSQTLRAAEWLGEPVRLGRELTDEESAKLSAYRGNIVDCSLEDDASAYLLDTASGLQLSVYYIDPLGLTGKNT